MTITVSDSGPKQFATVDRGFRAIRSRRQDAGRSRGGIETGQKRLGGTEDPENLASDSRAVTLDALKESIRDVVDVLYLVCRGAMVAFTSRMKWHESQYFRDELIGAFKGLAHVPGQNKFQAMLTCVTSKLQEPGFVKILWGVAIRSVGTDARRAVESVPYVLNLGAGRAYGLPTKCQLHGTCGPRVCTMPTPCETRIHPMKIRAIHTKSMRRPRGGMRLS